MLAVWSKCCGIERVQHSRHYATKHGNYGNNLSAVERQTKATELDSNLARQRNVVVKGKLAQQASTHASFIVAYNIAKHNKSLSDGEFIKKCMLDVADQVCPEHKKKFEEVSLSKRTVPRHIEAVDGSPDITIERAYTFIPTLFTGIR